MIGISRYPAKEEWNELLERTSVSTGSLTDTVERVFSRVKTHKDEAVKAYEQQFDQVKLACLQVQDQEFDEAEGLVPPRLKEAIAVAADNIRTFHQSQIHEESPVETMPGVVCWRKNVPIEKVGLYIPGGSAPLFSTVLMLGIPAVLAGCPHIILCTPPNKDGKVHPAVLYAAQHIGLREIYKAGGVQAIAAMTYGTETIPAVYKIFGPGNQYVMAAKSYAFQRGVAIDMPAGPSEVLVMADDSSNPAFVAADLLAQAEHGPDSQAILVTDSEQVLQDVYNQLALQIEELPRKELAAKSLRNSFLVLLESLQDMMLFSNTYAPEHLIISTKNPEQVASQVVNAGSVFLGHYSPESAGDYASGTNHSLPTSGFARSYGGVSLDSFIRKITFQNLTSGGFAALGPHIQEMANAEGLFAHMNAATLRLNNLNHV